MHYANCATFNADFDGDEINLHLPQVLLPATPKPLQTNQIRGPYMLRHCRRITTNRTLAAEHSTAGAHQRHTTAAGQHRHPHAVVWVENEHE